jgi:hypothetical protein
MVPGMTERERLAADARRLEWLADATLGPTRIGIAMHEPTKVSMPRPALPIGIWRRGLSSARILGQRVRLLQPPPAEALPRRASAPGRQAGIPG